MSNEADTCRTFILPKVYATSWEDDSIIEQLVLTYVGAGPLFCFDDAMQYVLPPSVLDRAFKGEL